MTKTGNQVKLGNALTEDTTIDGDSSYSMNFENMYSFRITNNVDSNQTFYTDYGNTSIQANYGFDVTIGNGASTFFTGSVGVGSFGAVSFDVLSTSLENIRASDNKKIGLKWNINPGLEELVFTDSIRNKGVEYAGDYQISAYTDYSIPSWINVKKIITGVTSINNLIVNNQFLTTGNTGNDFNILSRTTAASSLSLNRPQVYMRGNDAVINRPYGLIPAVPESISSTWLGS